MEELEKVSKEEKDAFKKHYFQIHRSLERLKGDTANTQKPDLVYRSATYSSTKMY